jgi:general secretion pathway protein L
MPERTIGLDIGGSSIKAVQVVGGLKGFRVVSFALVELEQEEGLETALNALFDKMALSGSGCSVSFQMNRVSFRNLSMPFKDKKKITQTLGYELEPLLPFPIETIATDYVMAINGDENRVLTASVQQDKLEDYLKILAKHNLDPDIVDVDGVPTAALLWKDEDETANILLIDIGSKTTSAILMIDATVVLVRSFPFGGDTFTDSIAKSKKVTKPEAESLKCQEDANGFVQIVKPVVESFCQSIRNTLHAFRYQVRRDAFPERVVLTGGGALLPGLENMMAEHLELPVEVLELTRQAALEFKADSSNTWNPMRMNGALALALRDPKNKNGFNFRVGRFSKTKKYEQIKGEAKRIAVYMGALLLAFSCSWFADYYVLKKQYDHLQTEITSIFKKTFPEVQRIVDPIHQMKVKIKEAKEATLLPAESLVQRASGDILRDIALHIPKTANADLSSLVIDEEKIRVKGLTDTFNTVDEIKNGLEESIYLKDVSIASAQLDRKTNTIRFEMVMGHK